MDPDTDAKLIPFARAFDLERLGDGDPIAGANLLAAMAISLANVARPGSGLVDKDGRFRRVGTSLFVSGSLSAGLVTERVTIPLGMRQSNLNSHFIQEVASIKQASLRPGIGRLPQDPRPARTSTERTLELLSDEFATTDRERPGILGSLTESPPTRADTSHSKSMPFHRARGRSRSHGATCVSASSRKRRLRAPVTNPRPRSRSGHPSARRLRLNDWC